MLKGLESKLEDSKAELTALKNKRQAKLEQMRQELQESNLRLEIATASQVQEEISSVVDMENKLHSKNQEIQAQFEQQLREAAEREILLKAQLEQVPEQFATAESQLAEIREKLGLTLDKLHRRNATVTKLKDQLDTVRAQLEMGQRLQHAVQSKVTPSKGRAFCFFQCMLLLSLLTCAFALGMLLASQPPGGIGTLA
eukprot:TRINITY_DN6530_c0_g1_i3.p1 TRINITY_DN6530_c0_g1~~TRINITY_DN6530_c0_g1_i3.p1  ORF type:complete len:198 (-),score=46.18 TRINITY_DN6530_c0_g1_i3:19-612(-)